MSRKLRVEYPGAFYHSMNRGDRRQRIFKDDADRRRFLETMTWKWIAERLRMGTAASLANRLRALNNERA